MHPKTEQDHGPAEGLNVDRSEPAARASKGKCGTDSRRPAQHVLSQRPGVRRRARAFYSLSRSARRVHDPQPRCPRSGFKGSVAFGAHSRRSRGAATSAGDASGPAGGAGEKTAHSDHSEWTGVSEPFPVHGPRRTTASGGSMGL